MRRFLYFLSFLFFVKRLKNTGKNATNVSTTPITSLHHEIPTHPSPPSRFSPGNRSVFDRVLRPSSLRSFGGGQVYLILLDHPSLFLLYHARTVHRGFQPVTARNTGRKPKKRKGSNKLKPQVSKFRHLEHMSAWFAASPASPHAPLAASRPVKGV